MCPVTTPRRYHHGDLRKAVLSAAVEAIGESGPSALSLRDLARRAGVSHAAPAHHFTDKAGVLTAVAAEGFTLLADALRHAQQRGGLLETGVAYVRFALDNRAYFEVMYRPDVYRADDPTVQAARARAAEVLYAGTATVTGASPHANARLAGIAAWSLVHGFATLHLNGALPFDLESDAETAARSIAQLLFSTP